MRAVFGVVSGARGVATVDDDYAYIHTCRDDDDERWMTLSGSVLADQSFCWSLASRRERMAALDGSC